jgi:hypothetical protein
VTEIDRIDAVGNITQHRTEDGVRAVCGVKLAGYETQAPMGNRPCRNCYGVGRMKSTDHVRL